MKRLVVALLLASTLCMTGCGDTKKTEPAASTTEEVDKASRQLKGLSPVSYYKEKGLYKYTYGESTDYNKVLRMKREVTAKFKDAFIIAFKNGEKMNVNEAIKEFKKNR